MTTTNEIKTILTNRFPGQHFQVRITSPKPGVSGSATITWTDGLSESFIQTAVRNIHLPVNVEWTFNRQYTRAFIQGFLKAYETWKGVQNGVEIVGKDDDALISCGRKLKLMQKLNENLAQYNEKAAIDAFLK